MPGDEGKHEGSDRVEELVERDRSDEAGDVDRLTVD